MYLVECLTKNGRFTVAVATPSELFNLITVLDENDKTVAWRIVDHVPINFGWSPHWKKYAPRFLQEHYAQSSE
jgi:hypothetical protein